tara:strand:+ start:2364 stop:4829 length:2466 start_codon:yes stop_codon:yes gene_type:complete
MAEELNINVVNPEAVSIETEDGGMIIDFDPNAGTQVDFNSNLAEHLEERDLRSLANELIGAFESDKDSRADWERTYIEGLDNLGLKIEERTEPWAGACGVYHPLLAEAVIRFQSQAVGEMLPASGPVRTNIVGKLTPEKEEQSRRVEGYMNYLLTETMTEYRTEVERMLFSLPLAGSAFKKIYWDVNMQRPCSMFIPAEDFVVSYGASDLITAVRATHVMRMTLNDIIKLQVADFYRDIDLPQSGSMSDKIKDKYGELTGDSPNYQYEMNTYSKDGMHTLLEMHVDLDLEGFEDVTEGENTGIALPYVVTIDKGSSIILSIRRNYMEDDPQKMRRQHFVHYQYMPGLGFYGFGLIHMVGGLAKSATSLLRQLVDAGTLSNLPGGLKTRGLRIKGDDTPIYPGEFRDVDVPGGSIRDNITFLPYKEPSGTLYQLLGNIVEEGRRFASITDLKVSDMNNQAPVGTTLALLERNMKVMTAIQSRLHASMRKELGVLSQIIKDYMPEGYEYEIDGDQAIKASDFDERVDIIPVSDPNAATMAQRIMQYQAALQLAQTAPQMYDLPKLHRQMLEVLGIRDPQDIIPLEDDIKPTDPVSENMNILNGKPVKAFQYQEHASHITVHMSMIQDPKVQELAGQAPNADAMQASLSAHIVEHLGFEYRKQIEQELGTELPPIGEPLPPEIEERLSVLVASAAQQLLGKNQQEAQQEEIQEQMEDPVIQMKKQELEIKQMQAETKAKIDEAKLTADMQKAETKATIDEAKLAADMQKATMKDELERIKIEADLEMKGADIGADIAKTSAQERTKGAELGRKIADKLLDKDYE